MLCFYAHVLCRRFDKADATAEVQRQSAAITDLPLPLIPLIPAKHRLCAEFIVYWIENNSRRCVPMNVEPNTSCMEGEH